MPLSLLHLQVIHFFYSLFVLCKPWKLRLLKAEWLVVMIRNTIRIMEFFNKFKAIWPKNYSLEENFAVEKFIDVASECILVLFFCDDAYLAGYVEIFYFWFIRTNIILTCPVCPLYIHAFEVGIYSCKVLQLLDNLAPLMY